MDNGESGSREKDSLNPLFRRNEGFSAGFLLTEMIPVARVADKIHPLITPRGLKRATLVANPASWTTPTTWDTSL